MKQQYLEAGEIVGTHGVRGELKLLPWADGPEFLMGFDVLYLGGAAYEVESARVHKQMVLCKLRGVDTVEQAQALRGKVVKVDRSGLEPAEGTVFIADLLGLPVFEGERELGRLADVMKLPANDVYVVRGEGGREYLIPAVGEFLEEVNVDEGFVRVRLIEGMETR